MRCPECDTEIDHLDVYVLEENRYRVSKEENGLLDWEFKAVIDGSEKKMEAQCPRCDESLGTWQGESNRSTVLDQSYFGLDFEEWLHKVMEALT